MAHHTEEQIWRRDDFRLPHTSRLTLFYMDVAVYHFTGEVAAPRRQGFSWIIKQQAPRIATDSPTSDPGPPASFPVQ